jgi:hypothetical protein
MQKLLREIHDLLMTTRDLVGAQELDILRLQTWSAERVAIFAQLQTCDLAGAAAGSAELKELIRELLDLDGRICARISEKQARLAEQIDTTRKVGCLLSRVSARPAQLLQRLA